MIAISDRELFIHCVKIYHFFLIVLGLVSFSILSWNPLYVALIHLPKFWPKEYADTVMISCIIEEVAEYIPIISTLCEKGEI